MLCNLCTSELLDTISTKDAKSSKHLKVVVCENCSLIQQDPMPTDDELFEYYTTFYRLHYKNTYTPKAKHIYRAGNNALNRIHFLATNNITNGSLLDVGAGGGEFTYLSNKNGFISTGTEPNKGYSEFAKKEYNINIMTGELNNINKCYDVITMFHVLEHMPSPLLTFKKLWSSLNPNGILFIEVPNINTKNASPSNIYFKAHLYYFNKATLIAYASKYFEVIIVEETINLRILFKRKEIKSNITLPDKADIHYALARLSKKGWFEYLFLGGGILKPFSKIKNLIVESSIKNKDSLAILTELNK